MHRSQVLFYILAAFLAGVFWASFINVPTNVILLSFVLGILIFLVSSHQKTFSQDEKGDKKRKIGAAVGTLIIFFGLGIFRFNYTNLYRSVLYEFSDRQAGGEEVRVTLRGYVASQPEVSSDRIKFYFRAKEIIIPSYTLAINEKTFVTAGLDSGVSLGSRLQINGSISKPENFDYFDYITYLKKEGARTLIRYPDISEDTTLNLGFFESLKIETVSLIFKIKNKFENSINHSISEPNASYINGILLGSRQNIPDDLIENFNKTGTTHILAISGYNIAVLGEAILLFLIFFVRRKISFWLSVAVIVIFTILTGASSSVVRAAIMGILIMFAYGYGRLYNPRNSIALAAFIMVAVNPLVLIFDIGFQLSFLAVLGLVYIYPILNQKIGEAGSFLNFKEIIFMTLSAQIAVLPILIFYFNSLSLVSLPVNILILPLVPYAMLLGFLSGVGGLILPILGQIFGWTAWALSGYQISLVKYFGSLPFSDINVSFGWPILVLVYSIMILFFYYLSSLDAK